MTDSYQGRTVALPDGTVGEVVAEYWSWQTVEGISHGHRLRVAVTRASCGDCPHGSGPVTRFVTADADGVRVLG